MISGEKGQITVEAVLILGFFIMIFIGVTVPMAFNARYATIDTTILSDAKFATEQIAGAANTIIVNGSRRTIDVYIPGYNAGSIHIATRICTNGNYLNTTVGIVRGNLTESYDFSSRLYGGGWSITTASGTNYIAEDRGNRYTFVVEYKSINSTTTNSLAVDCATDILSVL